MGTVVTYPMITGVGSATGGGTGGNTTPIALLTNASGAQNGTAVTWTGGAGTFTAVGNFVGTSAVLQYLGPDGVTWVAAGPNTTLSAAGGGQFTLPIGTQIRGVLSGGSPTGMYLSVQ